MKDADRIRRIMLGSPWGSLLAAESYEHVQNPGSLSFPTPTATFRQRLSQVPNRYRESDFIG